ERGSFTFSGLDRYLPAVFLDDGVADRQPQSSTLANRLGCEERFEDFTLIGRLNTRPVVAYRHYNPFTVEFCGDCNLRFSVIGQSLRSVRENVDPDLVELTGVAEHGRQLGKLELHRDLITPIILVENLQARLDAFGYRRLFQLGLVEPAEAAQILDDLPDSL